MGSSQTDGLDTIGIQRGGGNGESVHGPATSYTIVGRDISAEELIKRFPETVGKPGESHGRARALIKGVRDRTRTMNDPPEYMIASIGALGIQQPIIVANLGTDKDGLRVMLVVAGRQRVVSARIWTERHPDDPREVHGNVKGFPNRTNIDAELAALEANAGSNVFVGMTPSQMADHAVMLSEKGMPLASVAVRIGARDADHVQMLLDLGACAPEVQEAVDAMKVPLLLCATLKALSPEEQARRMARKNAGTGRKQQDAAAPPRPYARKAPLIKKFAEEAKAIGVDAQTVAALMWSHGDNSAIKCYPQLIKALESAEEQIKRSPKAQNVAAADPNSV